MSDLPTITLRIDSLAAGGDGVARDDAGRVTFVRGAAPGDVAIVALTKQKKSFARGVIKELVEPSPERVEPGCQLFVEARCGGCQWLHVSRAAQARAKQEIVEAALRRAVDKGLAIAPIKTPGEARGWRRRARLQWVRRKQDKAAMVGFFEAGGKRVTDVETCAVLEPALGAALGAVRAHLAPALTGRGELELLVGHAGAVHAVLRGPCKPAAVKAMVDGGHFAGAHLGRQRFGEAIELEPGFRATADQFSQASLAGNRVLLEVVDEMVGPRDGLRILELYAGAGNLTRRLADGAREVVAVDVHADLAMGTPLVNVDARQGTAAEVCRILARKDPEFDVVVLDPPRTGAAEALASLIKLGPARMVYVSCDPATLARDMDTLMEAGWSPVRAQPIDMMPQTAHVELVALLVRADADADAAAG